MTLLQAFRPAAGLCLLMCFRLIPTSLLLAAVLASACSESREPPTAPAAAQTVPVVVALGDSLTAGQGVAPDESYPSLVQARARSANYPHRVINAGVSGDTSADVLRRLDGALHPDARVLILAAGANDGLQGIPVAQIRSNLSTIIERAQGRGIRVLLCGMETLPTHGLDYSLDFHRVFPDLAARYQVALMPFLLEGVLGDPALNQPDRIHPNAAGYRRIAANIWPYLEPILRATSTNQLDRVNPR